MNVNEQLCPKCVTMHAVFNLHETFRDDFSYRNSPRAFRRFPLPFPEDSYMYSVNIEPHLPGPPGSVVEFAFDVDEHYVAECRERAIVLAAEPLDYITRQAQGDFVVMDQREGDLWAEAGMVTTQADWSLDFDLGMTFKEWHGPVPLAHELGVFDRARKFLLNLRLGQPVRRLNWTMTIHPRLDTSPENYPHWGQDRASVTAQNAGDLVHLRVELQGLWRLPRSNAIIFGIRCYLISVQELATIPKWARRVHRVLKNLHPALVDYKGLTRYRDAVVEWLAPFDDGAPTTPGNGPE